MESVMPIGVKTSVDLRKMRNYEKPNFTKMLPGYSNADSEKIKSAFNAGNFDTLSRVSSPSRSSSPFGSGTGGFGSSSASASISNARTSRPRPFYAGARTSNQTRGFLREVGSLSYKEDADAVKRRQERLESEAKQKEISMRPFVSAAGTKSCREDPSNSSHISVVVAAAAAARIPYTSDPYDELEKQERRLKFLHESKVLHGPFLPTGSVRNGIGTGGTGCGSHSCAGGLAAASSGFPIRPTRRNIPEMLKKLYDILRSDWPKQNFSVVATEDDHIMIRFEIASLELGKNEIAPLPPSSMPASSGSAGDGWGDPSLYGGGGGMGTSGGMDTGMDMGGLYTLRSYMDLFYRYNSTVQDMGLKKVVEDWGVVPQPQPPPTEPSSAGYSNSYGQSQSQGLPPIYGDENDAFGASSSGLDFGGPSAGHLPSGDGFIYYLLRCPWVRVRPTDTYQTLFPRKRGVGRTKKRRGGRTGTAGSNSASSGGNSGGGQSAAMHPQRGSGSYGYNRTSVGGGGIGSSRRGLSQRQSQSQSQRNLLAASIGSSGAGTGSVGVEDRGGNGGIGGGGRGFYDHDAAVNHGVTISNARDVTNANAGGRGGGEAHTNGRKFS